MHFPSIFNILLYTVLNFISKLDVSRPTITDKKDSSLFPNDIVLSQPWVFLKTMKPITMRKNILR